MSEFDALIRDYYASFSERDFGSLDEVLAEDFVYDDRRRVMEGTVVRGREAALEHWEGIHEPWDGFRVELEEAIEVEPGVVVSVARVSGRGPTSGAEVGARIAHLWRFRDGKLAHLEYFGEREQALAAARGEAA